MNPPSVAASPSISLERSLGVFGAVMIGLGSIVGTGVFVSLAIATGATGPSVLLAIIAGGILATLNGLSSAQLAAAHPVSGGTYEYGYRWLHRSLGFTAGWMFLCAKSASAATAALGCAGSLCTLLGIEPGAWQRSIAGFALGSITFLVLGGIRRSNRVNTAMVLITLGSLVLLIMTGLPQGIARGGITKAPFFQPVETEDGPMDGFLEACALMFVAFTGYGRVATMAEEVRDPARSIPQAILLTLFVAVILYVGVAFVAVGVCGAESFSRAAIEQEPPLERVAAALELRSETTEFLKGTLRLGAITAMLGVMMNLILGLSRVVLAMGRRGDLPSRFARTGARKSPNQAVLLVALMAGGWLLIGDLKTTWSFSAFAVLVYYAITNLAATRLNSEQQLFPRSLAWLGAASSLFLAFWVEPKVWLFGLVTIAAGLLWHQAAQLRNRPLRIEPRA